MVTEVSSMFCIRIFYDRDHNNSNSTNSTLIAYSTVVTRVQVSSVTEHLRRDHDNSNSLLHLNRIQYNGHRRPSKFCDRIFTVRSQ